MRLVTLLLLVLTLASVSRSGQLHPRMIRPRRRSREEWGPDDRGQRNQDDIDDDQDAEFWEKLGVSEVLRALEVAKKSYPDHAKNVVIFVGDGMSVPTVAAARIYKAQMLDDNFETPESSYLTFERMTHIAHSKTYAIDKQVGDSAATGSSIFSGVKTKYGTVGFDSHVDRGFPESMDPENEVTTILSWAQDAGMDTGVVTTARLTHATPAATYAHTFDRDYECDSVLDDVNESGADVPTRYKDIAWQMVHRAPGNRAKVLMGGGYASYFPEYMKDELRDELGNYTETFDECFRSDGVDLTERWLRQKESEGASARFVMKASDLRLVDVEETDYLLGLFGESHMQYDYEREEWRDPSISEMVQKAVQMLQKGDNGFFLMVEGGKIDRAHHNVWARKALSETVAMDQALETLLQMLADSGELDDTLIVVTADHSHTMSFAGYSDRGNSIIGLSTEELEDGLPSVTLGYANGKAYYDHNIPHNLTHVTRLNLSEVEVDDFDFHSPSFGPNDSETHGGDDVAIFAEGPAAFLFHTTHEEPYVAHVMAYAACVGPYRSVDDWDDWCQRRSGLDFGGDGNSDDNDGGSAALASLL